MTIDRALNGLLKLLVPLAMVVAGALAVFAVLDRLAVDEKAAAQRALMARYATLSAGALAPGSALACLDGAAGETVSAACESAVFASPQSAAAAVSYTAARLALLSDAQALAHSGDPVIAEALGDIRGAIEADRFGLAAHLLADRHGCTVDRCTAFALLHETAELKANLKGQPFDLYVARYAAAWTKIEAKTDAKPAPAAAAAPADVPVSSAPPEAKPVGSQYDFPSAASIPPVSIMNSEPALPKAAAVAPDPAGVESKQPMPPKRPQAQAAPPPAVQ